MRKLLISVLIIVLVLIAGYMCYGGISIINYRISGVKQIKQLNEDLDNKISVASKLVSTDYPTELSNINKSIKELKTEKENYENLVTISTDEQVQSSAKFEKYEIEYLWTKIGNHAKKEGVTMKLELKNSSTGTQGLYNLQFTVTGQYVGIADFIYDIENDSSLGFKIENFRLEPEEDNSTLKGTFVCKDISININSENITYTPEETIETDTNTNQNVDTNSTGNENNTNSTNTIQ